MSHNYNANQYEQAFLPHKLQNWQLPKLTQGQWPERHIACTRPFTDIHGRTPPVNIGMLRRASPMGPFVGTWDMPAALPGPREWNPTARARHAFAKKQKIREEANLVLSGVLKRCKNLPPAPVAYIAQDDPRSKGLICEPVSRPEAAAAAAATATDEPPCISLETVHDMANQPRALTRKPANPAPVWPRSKIPACPRSPTATSTMQPPLPVIPVPSGFVNYRL